MFRVAYLLRRAFRPRMRQTTSTALGGRALAAVAALAAVGVLIAGCGGSSTPGVANVTNSSTSSHSPSTPSGGSTTTPTQTSSSQTARSGRTASKYPAAFAYVDCMRSHGISNFPDPTSDGQINVKFAHGGKDGAPESSGIDRMSPQYTSADQTCRHLLPGGYQPPRRTSKPSPKI